MRINVSEVQRKSLFDKYTFTDNKCLKEISQL